MLKNKRGISLIVLVITIIVMIILATVVIVSITNNDVVEKANEAVDESNLKAMQETADIALSSLLLNNENEITLTKIIDKMGESGIEQKDLDKYIVTYSAIQGKVFVNKKTMADIQKISEVAVLDLQKSNNTINSVNIKNQMITNGVPSEMLEAYSVKYTSGNVIVAEKNDELTAEEATAAGWTYGGGTITAYSSTNETNIVVPSKIDDNVITTIGAGVFKDNTNIINVTLPESITTLGNEVFYGCTNLESINLPNSITSMGESTFRGCIVLNNVTLPQGITALPRFIFLGCDELTNIDLVNSNVTVIGEGAFQYCNKMTTITIPSTVQYVRMYVFYGWKSDQTIKVWWTNQPDSYRWDVFWNTGSNAQIEYGVT